MHDEQFPTKIELGRTYTDIPLETAASEKKGKLNKFYPSLYIQGIDGVADLPKEGVALIYFKRKTLTTSDEEGRNSAELEVHEICLPEQSKSEQDSSLEDAMREEMDKSKGDDEEYDEEDDDS